MLSRREVLAGAGVSAAMLSLPGCGAGTDMNDYEKAAAGIRTALAPTADMREIVRYATLAANSHNTQPWRFRLSGDRAEILPDLSRRTPAVDPDDHHLYASLGCAAENFALAAAARGRRGDIAFEPAEDGRIGVDLTPGPAEESPLFAAIPQRQCTRSEFDGRTVDTSGLALLEKAARVEGVRLILLTDRPRIETVLEQVIEGNTAQMNDPAFVRELKTWLRFNEAEALAARDGLFSAVSGNPTLPSWLSGIVFRFAFTTSGENDRYAAQIRSSAGIAIFVSERDDKAHWVNAGRAFQRFALQATALGVRHAFVNQPVEVPRIRAAFADWLGLDGGRPDLVLRFGYAPEMPKSLRRPVEAVLV